MTGRVDLSGFSPKVVYTHRSDLDGVVCAMIALDRFPGVRIVALDYDELDQVRETPCLVMDLNLPADHPLVATELEEAGPERIGHDGETRPLQPASVVIVDHHQATWYPGSIEDPPMGVRQSIFGEEDAKIVLFHHPAHCAAVIALEVLLPGLETAPKPHPLVKWAWLAEVADRWLEKEESFARARALTAVVQQAGFDFCLGAWLGMLPSDPGPAGMGAAAVVAETRANEGGLRVAIASMTEEGDHALGVCVAGSISHVAHGLLRYRRQFGLPEKPVALVILQSLVGESDVVAVGVRGPGALEVARRFGGGGHPESAGFQVVRCGIVNGMLQGIREEREPGAGAVEGLPGMAPSEVTEEAEAGAEEGAAEGPGEGA